MSTTTGSFRASMISVSFTMSVAGALATPCIIVVVARPVIGAYTLA